MKSYSYIIKLFVILLLILILLFSLSGCKKTAANETPIQDEQDIIKEEEAVEEEEETLADEEEEVKSELFLILNNFFEAVKEDKEYEFFDSYTRGMVGSEEEYRNGTKSDIFYIIQESHSSWKNLEAESLILEGDRAILAITGDRNAEGIESIDEKIGFKFINEEGSWKIDFYYPPIIAIIPVSPEPDIVINSAEITTLTISANIRSFFYIRDIRLELNDAELDTGIIGEEQYELVTSTEIPATSLIKGLNLVEYYVSNIGDQKSDRSWSFTTE